VKKVLVLGSTGLLGKSIYDYSKKKYETKGIARKDADYNFSLTNSKKLKKVILKSEPNVIFNCAAITSVDECQKNPNNCFKINADLVCRINEIIKTTKTKFIHISTDHFYPIGKKRKWKEEDNLSILNLYAKSKYMAEIYALYGNQSNLIIRTNFLGLNFGHNSINFSEWFFKKIQKNDKIELFKDYYHSPIYVHDLTKVIFELIKKNAEGIFNVSSRDVASKLEFGRLIFSELKKKKILQLKV